MAKFYGAVGYVRYVQTSPGIWEEKVTEYEYCGDLVRDSSRWDKSSDSTNDNLNINNQISIIADPYAYQNSQWIKYVVFNGTKWKITDVEVKYPRLILSMGGVYTNG